MVAIYCNHCVTVFRSITALHGHIKKHVPYGSYTFDFKSQTGYPSEESFPFVDSPELSLIEEDRILTEKRNFPEEKLIGIHETDETTSETNLKNEEENCTDELISNKEFSDFNVNNPFIENLNNTYTRYHGNLQIVDDNKTNESTSGLQEENESNAETYIAVVDIKEECEIDRIITDYEIGNSSIIDSIGERQDEYENLQSNDIHHSYENGECNKELSAYEFHRHLVPCNTHPSNNDIQTDSVTDDGCNKVYDGSGYDEENTETFVEVEIKLEKNRAETDCEVKNKGEVTETFNNDHDVEFGIDKGKIEINEESDIEYIECERLTRSGRWEKVKKPRRKLKNNGEGTETFNDDHDAEFGIDKGKNEMNEESENEYIECERLTRSGRWEKVKKLKRKLKNTSTGKDPAIKNKKKGKTKNVSKVKEDKNDPDYNPFGMNKKYNKKPKVSKPVVKERVPYLYQSEIKNAAANKECMQDAADDKGCMKDAADDKECMQDASDDKGYMNDVADKESVMDAVSCKKALMENIPKRRSGLTPAAEVKTYACDKRLYVVCSICGYFVQNAFKERHERLHDTIAGAMKYRPENLADCPKCNRRVLKSYINKHQCVQKWKQRLSAEERLIKRKETDKLRYKLHYNDRLPCYICGLLVRKYAISTHLKSHNNTKPVECEICKKKFKNKGGLHFHMDAVHGERNYQCDKCSRSFGHKRRLMEHMTTHSNKRPHICETCGKGFKIKATLNIHRRSHSDMRRFECPECGKKFSTKPILSTHIKVVHDNRRNYICSWPDCAKLFKAGTHLRRHMLLHLGEKPEKCDHCDASFTQITLLHNHRVKKHNIDKMPTPSKDNPCLDLPVAVIRDPSNTDGEKLKTKSTIFFPSLKDQPFRDLVVDYKESPLAYQYYKSNVIQSNLKQFSLMDKPPATNKLAQLQ